ncbi:MAG: hypothetical protein R3C14_23920 [Caldilineaceae bacterium]
MGASRLSPLIWDAPIFALWWGPARDQHLRDAGHVDGMIGGERLRKQYGHF